MSVGPDGAEFFGVRKKHVLRGTKFSLPKPKARDFGLCTWAMWTRDPTLHSCGGWPLALPECGPQAHGTSN